MDAEVDVEIGRNQRCKDSRWCLIRCQKAFCGGYDRNYTFGTDPKPPRCTRIWHAKAAARYQSVCTATGIPLPLPKFTGHALALGAISMAGTALDFVETKCVIEAYGPRR